MMNIPDFLNKDDPLIAKMVTSVETYASMYSEGKITQSEYEDLCRQTVLVSNVTEHCADEVRQKALIAACNALLSLALAIK